MTESVEIRWEGRTIQIEHRWIARDKVDAPLIVFLHEGLGSVASWRDFPSQLCAALRCRGLVYSRPGYGGSTPRAPDEHWGLDFMHRQAYQVLPAFLRALSLHSERAPIWLLGHSDGGSIALLYAARFAHCTHGVIALAPHVFVESESIESIKATLNAYKSRDLRERLARFHVDVDSAFYGWNNAWLAPGFLAWNIENEMASITRPILAVQGETDPYGTLEQIRAIQRRAPHAHLLELPLCGHSPHRDQRETVIEAVRGLIEAFHDAPSAPLARARSIA